MPGMSYDLPSGAPHTPDPDEDEYAPPRRSPRGVAPGDRPAENNRPAKHRFTLEDRFAVDQA
jgi:hypothetical protein